MNKLTDSKNFIKSSVALKKFKLFISPYKLFFKNQNKFLEGTLLAFHFDKSLVGYSDFLPWPCFGEQELAQQLKQIKQGYFNERFFLAQSNALLDAKARQKKQNLFFGLKIPPSHFLIEDLLNFKNPHLIEEGGFKKIKIKLQTYRIKEQAENLKALHLDLKNKGWRLDLNGGDWTPWRQKLDFLISDIDFIEDPFYKADILTDKKLFAEDWTPSPWSIKIVKPSRDNVSRLVKNPRFFSWKRIIFTHSFNHPLGQSTAAYWTGLFYKTHNRFFETGGIINQNLQKIPSYSLIKQGTNFVPPSGFGFGFGAALKKEKWKRWL